MGYALNVTINHMLRVISMASQKAYAVSRVAGNTVDCGLVGLKRHDGQENVLNSCWDIEVGPFFIQQ